MTIPAPTHLYCFGMEAHLHLSTTVSTLDEAVAVPSHHLVVARFIDSKFNTWSCLTDRTFARGADSDPALQAALRDYPVKGRPVDLIDTGVNLRAVAQKRNPNNRRERAQSNKIAHSVLQGPLRDARMEPLEGFVNGWGVSLEVGNRGDFFYLSYLAVQVWKETDKRTLIPATIHVRIERPLSKPSIVNLEEDGSIFHDADGKPGSVPEIFKRLRGRYPFGTRVHVNPRRPRKHPAYYLLSQVEIPPAETQLQALQEKFHGHSGLPA